MNEVITQFLDKEFEETKREHQIKNLFLRYEKLHGDKIEKIKEEFLVEKDLAVAALYCSDYVVVSSEIKEPISDEERLKELILLFRMLENGEQNIAKEDWFTITYIIAFIYRMASLIRKRYYFMLDKGVSKAIAAAQVGDLFVYELINYCEKLAKVSKKWLALVVKTALTQGLFSKSKEQLKEYLQLDGHSLEFILPQAIVQCMPKEIEAETNKAVPLQYYNETYAFYFVKNSQEIYHSTEGKEEYEREFKKILPLLSKEYTHNIKYLRIGTRIEKTRTEKNLFLIHSNTELAEGWLFLYSPIDDINLSLAEELLRLKINEIVSMAENKKLLPQIELEERAKKQKEEEEKERVTTKEEEKRSFIQRILAFFKRKKVQKDSITVKKAHKPSKEPLEDIKELFLRQLIVGLVGGIDLGLNIYDAYREHEFEINGVLESTIEQSPPTIFYSENQISYPTELLDPIISTLKFASLYITKVTGKSAEKIIPEEAFFEVKEQKEQIRLIEMGYSDERVIGIVADKYIETHLLTKKKTPKYKRRTIIKKVRELISARKRNKMEDVIKNLLSSDIEPTIMKKTTEDELLFYKLNKD